MITNPSQKRTLVATALTGATALFGWLAAAGCYPADASAPASAPSRSTPLPKKKKEFAPMTHSQSAAYHTAIEKTAGMVSDSAAQQMAQRLGLDILSLTWEDTGRFKGSSVGPNISDMTIQVAARDEHEKLSVTCMPVIRFPNFSDVTCDLDSHDFTLLVGNEKGDGLKRVSLYEFLQDPRAHLTRPESWGGSVPRTLLAPERDSKVLVSAQACFLPVPKQGIATFNPVVFNYQSYAKNPAVLTILATREGTSVTVIDNQRDAFESGSVWGQRLFHNSDGMRASLTGQRQSDFAAQGGDATSPVTDPNKARSADAGLNMVLLIQVPLKQKERPRPSYDMAAMPMASAAPGGAMRRSRAESNVENAVIGHGDLEGPFTELDELAVERDPRFPVRVTVQFYKATDNGVVSEKDLRAIKAQIDHVYAKSEYVGSLVTAGETGRITEYDGPKVEPSDWWERFWGRYEQENGVSREEAIRRLQDLLGTGYQNRPVTELYLRDLLRAKRPAG